MTSGPETQPQPQPQRTAAAVARAPSLPALLYVLGAFGVIAGAWGANQAIGTARLLLKPREVYVEAVARSYEAIKPLVPATDLERYSQREGEARYARRNAALPLTAVGLILSCMLFAGSLRAMRGDGWGLAAWSMAAAASIPYQVIGTALAVVTVHDLKHVFADAPSTAWLLVVRLDWEKWGELARGGLAILYFGACAIYLRTPGLRRHFSGGATRTPPSA